MPITGGRVTRHSGLPIPRVSRNEFPEVQVLRNRSRQFFLRPFRHDRQAFRLATLLFGLVRPKLFALLTGVSGRSVRRLDGPEAGCRASPAAA
jgi:hypothetical protein